VPRDASAAKATARAGSWRCLSLQVQALQRGENLTGNLQ
jgi:hypothetical protein